MNKCSSSGEQNTNPYPTAYKLITMGPWEGNRTLLGFSPITFGKTSFTCGSIGQSPDL